MNFSPPEWVRKGVETAIANVATNHYSHPKGTLRLRQALSQHYSASFGRSLNPDNEIIVSSGANEGRSLTLSLLEYSLTYFYRRICLLHSLSQSR
jgi:kynurenine aminotransferase